MAYSKSVEEFFDSNKEWQKEIVLLRETILSTGLVETLKWGAPVYTTDKNKNIVGLSAFKEYTGLWFFQGGLLKDSKKKLVNTQEGKTKAMRQWRFQSLAEIKASQSTIVSYIKEAIKNEEAGKSIKAQRGKPLVIPPELKRVLSSNKALNSHFENLSLSARRDYAEHIAGAKRETTKSSRLEKIIPLIMQEKGLHDKYKK